MLIEVNWQNELQRPKEVCPMNELQRPKEVCPMNELNAEIEVSLRNELLIATEVHPWNAPPSAGHPDINPLDTACGARRGVPFRGWVMS